jgi:hypothetical protein
LKFDIIFSFNTSVKGSFKADFFVTVDADIESSSIDEAAFEFDIFSLIVLNEGFAPF